MGARVHSTGRVGQKVLEIVSRSLGIPTPADLDARYAARHPPSTPAAAGEAPPHDPLGAEDRPAAAGSAP